MHEVEIEIDGRISPTVPGALHRLGGRIKSNTNCLMRLRPHRLCYTEYWSLAVGTRMEGPFFLGPRCQVGAENPLFFLFIIKFSWYTRGGRIEGIRTTLK